MKVKTIELNDILKYDQPTKFIVSSDDYDDSFTTPVLTAGKTFILGYTDEKEGVFNNLPAIIFDDFTTSFHYVDFPFKVKSSAMKILTPRSSDVSIKFIYYIMQGLKIDTELHKRYWISIFSKLKIQLPPLKTQEHIAGILDDAAALRDKTKQLLEEYTLLEKSVFQTMFGNPLKNELEFKYPKLKEVCKVSQGMQIAIANRFKEDGPNRYKYITIAFLNGRKTPEFIENPRTSVICDYDDIIMVRTGDPGRVISGVHGVFHNNFFKIDWDKEILNKEYFLAFLSNENVKNELVKRASSTTIPDLNHGDFYGLKVMVPPMKLQNDFAEKIALIEQQKDLVRQELKESEDLFNCLLQKAFKGELVPESQEV